MSATVNNSGAALSISSRENGTLLAKAFMSLNACVASWVEFVRNFKRTFKLSTDAAVVIIDLRIAAAPRPSKAPCKDKTRLFTLLAVLPIPVIALFALLAPATAPLGSTFTPRVAILLIAIFFL